MHRSGVKPVHSWLPLSVFIFCACGSTHGLDGGPSMDGGIERDSGSTADASRSDAGDNDAGDIDAGPQGSCAPDDAREMLCPEDLCDGIPTWHWDGERCISADCGACVGADCGNGTISQTECEQAHQHCEPPLCRNTGGTWLWWASLCGHYECGQASPRLCLVGAAACDCGSDSRFVPGVGCMVDSDCPVLDPLPANELCLGTGGTWSGVCCHSECGVPCDADCVQPACTCGPLEVFHPERGCEVGQRCMERLRTESCQGDARCEAGTLCCDDCGGVGCAGTPTCRYPICDPSPMVDVCGNNPLAP